MISSLAENFEVGLNVFHIHATNICIFENLPSVAVSDALERMQLEVIELQYKSVLHSKFCQEAFVSLQASL
jgi:hypothetical protein